MTIMSKLREAKHFFYKMREAEHLFFWLGFNQDCLFGEDGYSSPYRTLAGHLRPHFPGPSWTSSHVDLMWTANSEKGDVVISFRLISHSNFVQLALNLTSQH